MVSIRTSLIILLLVVLVVLSFTYVSLSHKNMLSLTKVDPVDIVNNTTSNISMVPVSSDDRFKDDNLTLPLRENFLNSINWSDYSLLSNPYISEYLVAEPNSVNNHTFLYAVIVVEIMDTKNKTDIFNQMSGVVLEERRILGPDSGPTVCGSVNGSLYYAAMRPYETEVLTSYLP